MQTKCAYVWMGPRTCAVPFANCLDTVRCKPKFVVFCANTKGIGGTGCPVFALGLRKINLPHAGCELFFAYGSLACTGLKIPFQSVLCPQKDQIM